MLNAKRLMQCSRLCLMMLLLTGYVHVYAGSASVLPGSVVRPQSAPINIPPRPPTIAPIGPIRIVPSVSTRPITMVPVPQMPWKLVPFHMKR